MTDTIVTTDGAQITLADVDGTRTFLVLHGGGGVATMAPFAELLAERTRSRVLLPTHPGFGGTARPDTLSTVRALAAAYVNLLETMELSDVTVVGSSFGGWVAAEIALLASPRVTALVLVDGTGIEVDGHPMADAAVLSPGELAARAFYDPAKAPRPPAGAPIPSGPSKDILAMVAYTGPTLSDPTLFARLDRIDVPVHVVWGDSDGIVDPEYGRAYADAISGSTFTVLPRTGHLPSVESPEQLLDVITDLVLRPARPSTT